MDKIFENVCKEIECIAEQGINNNNLDNLDKLVDIKKDLVTIKAMEVESEMRYYDDNPYSYYGYGEGNRGGNYGRYRDYGDRMSERGRRIMESLDNYRYGRERYRDGGSNKQMKEGLEDVMYSVTGLVEAIMETAETAEEKETIRKHLEKIKHI